MSALPPKADIVGDASQTSSWNVAAKKQTCGRGWRFNISRAVAPFEAMR